MAQVDRDEEVLVGGGSITRGEAIEILESLARTGGATAKIQALKLLQAMDDDEGPGAGGFDDLDGDSDTSPKLRSVG